MRILTDRAEQTIRAALENARDELLRYGRFSTDPHGQRATTLDHITDAFTALAYGTERLEVHTNAR